MIPTAPITGREFLRLLQQALAAAGMTYHPHGEGRQVRGWVPRSDIREEGFSIRNLWNEGRIAIRIILHGGEAGLKYKVTSASGRKGSTTLRDPIGVDALAPRIEAVFQSFGLEVESVRHVGNSLDETMDVAFNVVVFLPDWLMYDTAP